MSSSEDETGVKLTIIIIIIIITRNFKMQAHCTTDIERISANFELKTLISNFGNKKLNLNPYNYIDDNLINNPEIDVDSNHLDSILINDYYDSDQLHKILKGNSEQSNIIQSIMHLNTCRLILHIDSLYASLQARSHGGILGPCPR